MSLNNKTKQQGFTIVELLIVIVVIGILAAITIVAYNGIQQRAKNSQVIAGANAYYKAILNYKTTYNVLPTATGCLGANYPGNNCWMDGSTPNQSVNATLDTQLSEFIGSNKPTLATSLLKMGSGGIYTNLSRAGLTYTNSGANKELRYYLDGNNQTCISGFSFANEADLTNCIITLTN